MLGLVSASAHVAAQTAPAMSPSVAPALSPAPTPATLVAGTPIIVMTNEEISTASCWVGGHFGVTVVQDVTGQGGVAIPAGTTGSGEITFCTKKGGFGKPGILGIALRTLDLNGKQVLLDGHYREEGRNNNGATAATWFAVGIFSGFITGRAGVIPKGRELRARTGEDILFAPGAAPSAAVPPAGAGAQPASAATPSAGARQPGDDGKVSPPPSGQK